MEEVKQRVLVTGGAGRLGLRVCRALRDLGYEVLAFALPSRRNRKRVIGLGSGISVQWGDLTDPQAVRPALQEVQAVVHRAGLLPPVTDEHPEPARRFTGPVFWLTRRCIGPVFGGLIVRLLAARYGFKSRSTVEAP